MMSSGDWSAIVSISDMWATVSPGDWVAADGGWTAVSSCGWTSSVAVEMTSAVAIGVPVKGPKGKECAASFRPELISFTFISLGVFAGDCSTAVMGTMAWAVACSGL